MRGDITGITTYLSKKRCGDRHTASQTEWLEMGTRQANKHLLARFNVKG